MKPILIAVTLLVWCMSACIKEHIDAPDFEVRTEKSAYKAGEPVTFLFKGNAYQLSFYSGEQGSNYLYHNGHMLQADKALMSFATTVRYGTQPNQFSVLYSTDFNGSYDSIGLKSATWTDITDQFVLAETDVDMPSGTLDVKQLAPEGGPIYFAFKYTVRPQTEYEKSRIWTLRNFSLQLNTEEGLKDLVTQADITSHLVSIGPKESGQIEINTSRIQFKGNAVDKDVYTEDWILTSRLDLSAINLPADWATAIKGYSDFRQETISYIYQTPGNYTATFLARNANVYGDKAVIKEVPVTITED